MKCKCQFPEGVTIRPNGINALDPCLYKRCEEHRNVTVFLDQCVHCGHIEISWCANENSQTIVYAELDRNDDDEDDDDEIIIQRSVDLDDDDTDYDDNEEDDEWLDNPD